MIDFAKDVMPLRNRFYRLALRLLHDSAEAEDITQETLIRLWQRRMALATAADAETLGFVICHNLSRDALSRAGRNYEQIDEQDENFALDSSQTAIDQLAADDRHDFLCRIINRLPPKQRVTVQLRDIEGKSYREIAAIMQITEEQVKITLFRARQSLKLACKTTDRDEL